MNLKETREKVSRLEAKITGVKVKVEQAKEELDECLRVELGSMYIGKINSDGITITRHGGHSLDFTDEEIEILQDWFDELCR